MAEDQTGMRKDYVKELAPWTSIFSAFKIALDPKKLVLAGAGILILAVGWYVLSVIFFSLNSKPAEWTPNNYPDLKSSEPAKVKAAWDDFKRDRQRWNLLYEMAGAPNVIETGTRTETKYATYDIGDLADSPTEFEEIRKRKDEIDAALARLNEKVRRAPDTGESIVLSITKDIAFGVKPVNEDDRAKLVKDLADNKFELKDLKITGEGANTVIILGPYTVALSDPSDKGAEKARRYKSEAKTVEDIRADVRDNSQNSRITNLALALRTPRFKPYGRLRTMPWFEDRGPNPYLLVTGNYVVVNDDGTVTNVPWTRGGFIAWLFGEQAPVLLEPLVKFFRPLIYLFDPAGGFLNRVYLLLVIVWLLATWALFGGAITRIAAVQVARTNERVGLFESLKFVWTRYKSFFCAPLFPLLFLFVITVVLFFFGLLEVYLFVVGDLLMPLLWPLVLLAGLIMAVVLVGLLGYPLMYSTISAEGSDAFDAISRSYSYVYQAPWHYLWYSLVAVIYGAVLVFFVGFMGSLLIYMSKWSVALAPAPDTREPSYLFMWAPTSYGWRDLLLYKSTNATVVPEVSNSGKLVPVAKLQVNKDYYEPNWHNYWAAFVMSVWLYILFLLVLGFSYSYFWTASTIIYLLMRRKVDDTELDEIHLEEEPEQTWTPPATTPPAAEPPKSNAVPVQMVESPILRTPPPAAEAPVLHTPAAVPEPDPGQTQLAPPAALPDNPHETPPESSPPPESTH
jgi:hypothetical protein